jgi:hypothetical protein
MHGKSGRYVITVKDIQGWMAFLSGIGQIPTPILETPALKMNFFSLVLRYHVAGDLSKNATKIYRTV